MKHQLSTTLTVVAVIAGLSFPVHAYKLKSGEAEFGELTGKLQVHHVADGEDNGYDPSEGTSYLVKLKYVTPSFFNGLKLGVASYSNGDFLNQTDFTLGTSDRLARGIFLTNDGATKTIVGEAYARYTHEKFKLHGGHMMFDSPLTKITYNQVPNFYTVFGGETTAVKDFTLGVHQITEMAFGTRSITDWALIGEGTNSAGAAVQTSASAYGQGEWHNIADISVPGGTTADTNGITALNVGYTGFKGIKLNLWNYYVDDIANNLYIQADKTLPVGNYKLALSGQYLNQTDAGDDLANAAHGALDFDLLGIKATLKGKGWAIYGAYNHSFGDNAMLNAWGGDPAYTSSIFSRNAYREDVDAFKIGAKYQIMKGLTVMASYANYGESNTSTGDSSPPGVIPLVGPPGVSPANDADEFDFIVVYKPTKNWMFKAFHAIRTSEYDDAVSPPTVRNDLTQGHTRLIAAFTF